MLDRKHNNIIRKVDAVNKIQHNRDRVEFLERSKYVRQGRFERTKGMHKVRVGKELLNRCDMCRHVLL